MMPIERAGALSALTIAATYLFGFGLFLGVLDRSGYEGAAGDLAFVLDNQVWLSAAMIILYVIAGCALVVLGLAFHERFKSTQSALTGAATAFAMIWAGLVIASGFVGLIGIETMASLAAAEPLVAASAWVAISVVQNALGGGIELVGGVWMLIISALALRFQPGPFQSGRLSSSGRALHYLGLVIGIMGILTVIPGLGDFAALFGMAQIVWFVWTAFDMMKHCPSAKEAQSNTATAG